MTDPVNSILINEADNVATAIVELPEGDVGRYLAQGRIVEIVITENIPKYHKFAVRDILKNDLVRKYGEVIGQAVHAIGKGSHVHVHNIISPGDKAYEISRL
jgi:altronate dehydratase small subunit